MQSRDRSLEQRAQPFVRVVRIVMVGHRVVDPRLLVIGVAVPVQELAPPVHPAHGAGELIPAAAWLPTVEARDFFTGVVLQQIVLQHQGRCGAVGRGFVGKRGRARQLAEQLQPEPPALRHEVPDDLALAHRLQPAEVDQLVVASSRPVAGQTAIDQEPALLDRQRLPLREQVEHLVPVDVQQLHEIGSRTVPPASTIASATEVVVTRSASGASTMAYS